LLKRPKGRFKGVIREKSSLGFEFVKPWVREDPHDVMGPPRFKQSLSHDLPEVND